MLIDTETKRSLLDIDRFKAPIFPCCVTRSGAPMFGKPTALSQLWRNRVPHHTTLYAFRFWYSSYTLVATVFRFSPSQSVGFFLVGLRSCKDCTSLPYYAERQLGLLLGILRGCESIPHSLEAGLDVFSKTAGPLARFRGPRWLAWGFAAPRGCVIGTCQTDPCLLAQNRGI